MTQVLLRRNLLLGVLTILGLLPLSLWSHPACAQGTAVPPVSVNVDPGVSETNNVGIGFGVIGNDGMPLTIKLTSDKGTILDSEITDKPQDTKWHKDSATQWTCSGYTPDTPFWCVIKCTVQYPGPGEGNPERWVSVSDVHFIADTENKSGEAHRPPSDVSSTDDASSTLFAIPIDDDNQVSTERRDGADPEMNYDQDTDVLDAILKIVPKKSGKWEVCFSHLTVYTDDGTEFSKTNRTLAKDQSSSINLRLKASWDTPSGTKRTGYAYFQPDSPSEGGWNGSTTDYILLGCDIRVDTSNNGVIDSTKAADCGEDFCEALPSDDAMYDLYPEYKYGMIVPVNDGDSDGDGNPDNGWNGTDWSGPGSTTVENTKNLRPGLIRSLGVSSEDQSSLERFSPVVCITKASGDGAVRLFTTDTHEVIGAFVDEGDAAEAIGSQTLWKRTCNADLPFLVEGLREGEVMLACQLLLNGVLIHEDKVRINVIRVALLVDTDRDGVIDPEKDLKRKEQWTKSRGAIFSVSCSRFDGSRNIGGMPIPDALYINDDGNPANENFTVTGDGAKELAPLLIRKISTIRQGFKVFLKTKNSEGVQRTHIFKKIAAGERAFWGGATAMPTSGADASGGGASGAESRTEIDITRWVDPSSKEFQGDASGDTTFGIRGLMFRYVGSAPPALKFSGLVDFTLELRKDAAVIASSDVQLKVAPWIMLSRNQDSEQVWACKGGAINRQFLIDLGTGSGGQLQTEADTSRTRNSQWFQDQIEIGYTQRPGGPKTHAVLRMPYVYQPTWPLYDLLASDVGIFQLGSAGGSGDYGGNLEVLPPNGTYPLGRIVMGNKASTKLKDFMVSQEVQSPMCDAPVTWLRVGHIDEVTSFLAGGRVAIADPTLAWNLISDTNRIPEAKRHQAVFFANNVDSTGAPVAAPHGGVVSGGCPTRLYAGPATGTIKAVKVATRATGAITLVVKTKLANGDSFTIGDGQTAKNFVFKVTADYKTPDNTVVVDVSNARDNNLDDVKGAIIGAIVNSTLNVSIDLDPTADSDRVDLTAKLPGTIGNVGITWNVQNAEFKCMGMKGGANDGLLHGETVTISDGTATKVFEFTTLGTVTSGHVKVDLSSDCDTASQVCTALFDAITNTSGFGVKAMELDNTTIHLWNEKKGTTGNQAITKTVAHADFQVSGMTGGTNDDAGFSFATGNWNYVRTFTYTADGKPVKGQVATIKDGGCHDGWIEIETVYNTTSKVIAGSGTTEYIAKYTSSVAPNQGSWYNTPVAGDKYVVVGNTQFWSDADLRGERTPALVTVEEVLADSDFGDLNKIDAQGQIDLVRASLNTAMSGLTFQSVPCLFFGTRPVPPANFADVGKAVAFNPGPTNLQTVNGLLYVPKQYCPRNQATGEDVYQAAISNALGTDVQWVDDWDYYHVLLGEVHCGTAVRHKVLGFNWWSNQP